MIVVDTFALTDLAQKDELSNDRFRRNKRNTTYLQSVGFFDELEDWPSKRDMWDLRRRFCRNNGTCRKFS